MAKDAFYFPHDSNASEDPKISALISKYGYLGYGWFWRIIELLRNQADYKYPLSKYTFDTFARVLQCERTTAEEFINDCCEEFSINNSSLLYKDDSYIWSESLIKRMKHLDDKRQKARESANKRWDKSETNANAMPTQCETDASKVKSSKVKESKESKVSQEKHVDPTTPFKFFEDNFDSYTSYEEKEIESYIEMGMDPVVITSVMKMSKIYGAKSWSYVKKALEEKLELGIKTIADWESYEATKKEKKVQKTKPKEEPCPYRYDD